MIYFASFYLLLINLFVNNVVSENGNYLDQRLSNLNVTQKLSEANNEFGLNLFNTLSVNNENTIISPISLTIAFGMLYLGSNGLTSFQLRELLCYEKFRVKDEELNDGFNELIEPFSSNNPQKFNISIANSVVFQENLSILSNYTSSLKEHFRADFLSVDFKDEGQKAIDSMNEWIKNQTKGKINKFFEKQVEPDTVLILLNAVYFKGIWLKPFHILSTSNRTFFNFGLNETKVEMMSQSKQFWNYTNSKELDSQLVELEYIGDKMSLIVILPNQMSGLHKLKSVLNSNNLNIAINSMSFKEIDRLSLPKFKIEQKYDLESVLSEKLNIFSDTANFSRISESIKLKVSKVVHKLVIEVNERGTEGVGLTEVEMVPISGSLHPIIFKADHPFIYLIREKINGLILFIGQINKL